MHVTTGQKQLQRGHQVILQNLYLDWYITGSSQPPGQEAGGTYQGREIEGFLRLNESSMDTMTTCTWKSQYSFF